MSDSLRIAQPRPPSTDLGTGTGAEAQTPVQVQTAAQARSAKAIQSLARPGDVAETVGNKTATAPSTAGLTDAATGIPARTKTDSVQASAGLATEWTSAKSLDVDARMSMWFDVLPAGAETPERKSLESLLAASKHSSFAETKLPKTLRQNPNTHEIEVDVHTIVAQSIKPEGTPATRSQLERAEERELPNEADSTERGLRGAETREAAWVIGEPDARARNVESQATYEALRQQDSSDRGGQERQQGDESGESGTEDDDELQSGYDGDEPLALLPDQPRTISSALAQTDLGSENQLKMSLSAGLSSTNSDVIFLAPGHPVSVSETEALLEQLREDAVAIGSNSLAAQSDAILDQIGVIESSEELIHMIDHGNVPIEQLLSMIMIHVAENQDEKLRNKLEEMIVAEQNEARREATEGIGNIVESVYGESTDAYVAELQAADAQLNGETKSQTVLMQEVQYITQQWQQIMELMSNMNKSLHDMAMTPIRNLR
ncbi:MAG: hypothetical protein AAFP04_01245 [Myxococcota bacterium]